MSGYDAVRNPAKAVLVLMLVLLGGVSAQSTCPTPAELLFTFWGSPQEKTAVESMVTAFNDTHPDIHVRAQHIPTGYPEKMTTMLAGGTLPDVGYMGTSDTLRWATDGNLYDLSGFLEKDPDMAQNLLPGSAYASSDGKIAAFNTANETSILFYRKDLFEQAVLELPPTKAADAWTWDAFVEVAKKLTKDRNGNDATSPDFDPDAIDTYGINFPNYFAFYLPFVYSNGGQFANEDGTEFLLNQPAAVKVFQDIQDLIYKFHVAPNPTQVAAFPSAQIMMLTGKVAMSIGGHYEILDYNQVPSLDWSVGVLPKYKEPVTVKFGGSTVIFATTPCPEAAWEFYKFHNDPEYVDLFKEGLWMPLQKAYYTDAAKTKAWLEGEAGVYPPEAKEVFVDYTLNDTPVQLPNYLYQNTTQIFNDALNPAMERLFSGEGTAQEIMDEAARVAAPLMQGRW